MNVMLKNKKAAPETRTAFRPRFPSPEKNIISQTQKSTILINSQQSIAGITTFLDSTRSFSKNAEVLCNRNTIEFLGFWDQINNPGFNPIEFDGIKSQSGLNSFILTRLNQIAIQQMKLLTADERTPKLPDGKKWK